MNTHRFIALFSGVGLLLAACGGTTAGSSSTSGPPVAAANFATSYAHAVCDDLAGCCQKNGLGYDAATCVTAVEGLIQAYVVNPANASGATYDANAAGDCVAQVKAAASACDDVATQSAHAPDACSRVYSGKKQVGETCASSADCAASPDGAVTCLQWSSTGSDGATQSGSMCQLRKTPKGGEPCANGGGGMPPSTVGACGYEESATFVCDYSSSTCKPRAEVGAACTTSDFCVTTAYCKDGSCAARSAIGGACSDYDGSCDAQSRCDSSTKKCVAKAGTGESCTQYTDCASGSCMAGRCSSSSYADPSVCGGTAH